MATGADAQGRLSLSLLERLTDRAPNLDRDPPVSRLADLRELKEAVRRDLSALLNTKRENSPVPPEFVECNSSLLSFGIPDFTPLSLKSPNDQNELRRHIESAIRRFEPRLTSVVVTLEGPGEITPVLRFRVSALLRVEPVPEPVRFDTVLETDSGQFVIQGSGQ